MTNPKSHQAISEKLLESIRSRIGQGEPLRQSLPDGGKLLVDRQVPFLCVYRQPAALADSGTARLVTGEAAHMVVSAEKQVRAGAKRIVTTLAQTLGQKFGAFLLVEVWSSTALDEIEVEEEALAPRPAVRIFAAKGEDSTIVVNSLEQWLGKIVYQKQRMVVEVVDPKKHPERLRPLLSSKEAQSLGCIRIGIEVKPHYRDAKTGTVFPPVLTRFRRGFSRALQHAFFEFATNQTPLRPPNFHSLGRRAMAKAVWEVDNRLAEIDRSFDFLLQLTPVGSGQLWTDFKRSGFEKAPLLRYRSLPVDPSLMKRRLFSIPLEHIDDPAVTNLLREKQLELDRQLTMLVDRGTKRFMYGSLQLFGGVTDTFLRQAESVIEDNPARSSERGRRLTTDEFITRAKNEIEYYRSKWDGFTAKVEVRSDMLAGLMVSKGHLLVSPNVRIPADRAEALIQHEVGTHLVTYYNGSAQPFRQLASGLAGYDTLQEGLAVLAEHLVGGLSRPRLRLLAGRVLVASAMIDGASFVESFRRMRRYGFEPKVAFSATIRVFRGGGLTKDACYLKGLLAVLDYLKDGGNLERLFVGKIAVNHIPIVKELQSRKILRAAPLMPRYLSEAASIERLERLRNATAVSQLAEKLAN